MDDKDVASQSGKWFLAWWDILPTHLFTSRTRGSREEAWKEWKKINPDRTLCAAIGTYTKKRTAYWQQQLDKGAKMDPWKHGVRLLKYRFWEDGEDKDTKSVREQGAMKNCSKCRDKPIDHSGYGLCWGCYDKRFHNGCRNEMDK